MHQQQGGADTHTVSNDDVDDNRDGDDDRNVKEKVKAAELTSGAQCRIATTDRDAMENKNDSGRTNNSNNNNNNSNNNNNHNDDDDDYDDDGNCGGD